MQNTWHDFLITLVGNFFMQSDQVGVTKERWWVWNLMVVMNVIKQKSVLLRYTSELMWVCVHD